MALARYHSRIFAAWRSVHTLLRAVDWPAHEVGGGEPVVSLVDQIPDQQREVVAIVPVVDDDDIEWVQLGAASREERFVLEIVIRSYVPGCDGDQVIDRLEELAELVQDQFYNTTTGVFSPPPFNGVQALGGINHVRPAVMPSQEGWVGECSMNLELLSRI